MSSPFYTPQPQSADCFFCPFVANQTGREAAPLRPTPRSAAGSPPTAEAPRCAACGVGTSANVRLYRQLRRACALRCFCIARLLLPGFERAQPNPLVFHEIWRALIHRCLAYHCTMPTLRCPRTAVAWPPLIISDTLLRHSVLTHDCSLSPPFS